MSRLPGWATLTATAWPIWPSGCRLPLAAPGRIVVNSPSRGASAFSRGKHERYLRAAGVKAEKAEQTTSLVYEQLLAAGATSIDTCTLGYLTYLALEQEVSRKAAKRYLVWSEYQRSGRPLILMICGTVGTGKSTIATALANQLDIVRMQSTDMLREVMRTMISERLLPILHTSSFNAWSVLAEQKSSLEHDDELLLAEGFRAQVDLLSAASEAVIERTLRERVWLIMEGVHIHPSILEKLPQDTDAVIAPIMLAVLKRRDLKERIRGRSTTAPQRRSSRYLEHFDAIWQLQSFLLSEADRTRIPIILNGDRDSVVREIMRTVIDSLAEDFSATPTEVFRYSC